MIIRVINLIIKYNYLPLVNFIYSLLLYYIYLVHFTDVQQAISAYSISKQILPFGFAGGGPRVVVSTTAFHARVRGSVPGLGGLKETKIFLPHPRVKVSIVGSLRDRE